MSLIQKMRGIIRSCDTVGVVNYNIGEFVIELPANHELPSYQKSFRLYDRFVQMLAPEHLPGWIVDIGANVGDSAAAMLSGTPKRILCVEPYADFRKFLIKNASILEKNGSELVVVEYAISRTSREIFLAERAGTAYSALEGTRSETVKAKPLDEVIAANCGGEGVSFIKCDVDGYDGDVLLSGQESIKTYVPPLFFECYLPHCGAVKPYMELADYLLGLGYLFTIHDNFGMPLTTTSSRGTLEGILQYLVGLENGESRRTFHYVDCFAYRPGTDWAERVTSRYRDFVGAKMA
jgi:FkbM family methyltransferase